MVNRPRRHLLQASAIAFSIGLFPASALESPEEARILWVAQWNPDGTHFAVGGIHALWLFDSATYKRKSLLPKRKDDDFTVMSVAWHPSRPLLAVSSNESVNGIYDIVSRATTPLKLDVGRGVSWNPKGDALAISSPGDGHLRIWNAKGTLLHNHPRHKEAVGLTGVAWSPDGERIVTLGKYLTLHDDKGAVIHQITHRPKSKRFCLPLCVEWHPSGELFAMGDYGNEMDEPALQFWSRDGKMLDEFPIEGGTEIRNLSWSADGQWLATASDGLRIWARSGQLKSVGESADQLWGVDWHPDGTRIITSSQEGRVTLWDSSPKVVREIVSVRTRNPTR